MWRGEKGRCCWLGRKEGCRMSCNTGNTGSEGSRGRKDSPGKGNTHKALSKEACLAMGLPSTQSQADSGEGPHGVGSPVSVSISPTRIKAP